ncbi:MAG: lysylphosphatidylglycerol synthase transmembrane domain-containing protein [Gordonia sp. (in: high G+C Gram-positive bacteria)]|uniref:lysylphosphatidylglycerol synthase transmembrane domain-containing protein n=1 Tax=Gordonia sp. (in: high G+C Gram-positive bacteria) TaxID=84139 RepID=UPI0039E5F8AD
MADDTPDDDAGSVTAAETVGETSRWTWQRRLKVLGVVVVVAILVVELVLVWPHLAPAWKRVDDIHWWWVLACIAAAALSMDAPAEVQRVLMRAAGVKVRQRESLAVVLASNSISQTMPGGQVLAPAFIYRESRKWGATPIAASWQLVMSGLLAGVGLALLGLGGAFLAGAKTSPFSVLFTVSGFLVFVVVMQYLARHPESLEGVGRQILGWINKFRDRPADHGTDRLHQILEQLRAVKLRRRHAGQAFGWSLFNWVADVACLAFACYAIGAEPGIPGLMLAYATSKAVGSAIPLLPGGLGVVEATLTPALASAGMPLPDAIMVMIIYRAVSWLLVAIVGWVVIAFRYRHAISSRDEIRIEKAREEGAVDPDDEPRHTTHDRSEPESSDTDGDRPTDG